MKTKRILTTLLAALMLASTLAACSRRDQFRPPETDTPAGEQTTVAGQTDVSNPIESNPAGTNPNETNQSGGDVTEPTAPPETTPTDPNNPIPKPPGGGRSETHKITGNPHEG